MFSCSESQHELPVDLPAVAVVDPRNALADGADELIRNGARKLRHALDGVVRSEYLDLVAHAETAAMMMSTSTRAMNMLILCLFI